MTMTRLVRSELRKLTTTKMPLAFLGALVVIASPTSSPARSMTWASPRRSSPSSSGPSFPRSSD